MTRKPKRKKARSLLVDLKLRSGPSKAGQIVYEEERITREQGKEYPAIQDNMFSSRSKSFSKEKGIGKEGRKRVLMPVKKRFSGTSSIARLKDFIAD